MAQTIQIIEKQNLVRKTLCFLLNKQEDIVVTNSFDFIEDFFEQGSDNLPNIVFIGLNCYDKNWKSLIRRIKNFSPSIKIAVYTTISSIEEKQEYYLCGVNYCFSIEDNYEYIISELIAKESHCISTSALSRKL